MGAVAPIYKVSIYQNLPLMHLLLLNGPNLNLLGQREPDIYGTQTLDDILQALRQAFPRHTIQHLQSNYEGALCERIQAAFYDGTEGLIINAGALTHYSYALHDALAMLKIPKIEVHLSHIFARESFRHTSVISPACHGMISGLGAQGYHLAVAYLTQAEK